MPGFAVEEVDPTGAGDCFGAAFVCFWLRGAAPAEALRIANACGALAVTRKGPMEGIHRLADVEAFIAGAGTRA
ncbi:carbohydrate kinase family protein [Mesorhizobium sp.]